MLTCTAWQLMRACMRASLAPIMELNPSCILANASNSEPHAGDACLRSENANLHCQVARVCMHADAAGLLSACCVPWSAPCLLLATQH